MRVPPLIRTLGIALSSFPENLLQERALDYINPESRGIRLFMERAIPATKDGLIALDVGAGSRKWRGTLENKGYTYRSSDIEEQFSIEGKGCHDIIGSIEDLPIDDNSFDLVVCTQVLEHIREPQQAVNELNRILRPGGTVILTTNFHYGLHGAPHDYFRFSSYALTHLFSSSGLEISEITSRGGYLGAIAQFLYEFPYDVRNKFLHGTTSPEILGVQDLRFSRLLVFPLFLPVYLFIKWGFWIASFTFQLFEVLGKSDRYALGYGVVATKKS